MLSAASLSAVSYASRLLLWANGPAEDELASFLSQKSVSFKRSNIHGFTEIKIAGTDISCHF